MENQKYFSIVVAINNESLIGIKEYGAFGIPWPIIKEDMDFFRSITTKTPFASQVNVCIVGSNTWLTLPNYYKRNKKRFNIVISRSDKLDLDAYATYVASFNDALILANSIPNLNEIFVIGGSVIYDMALSHPLLKSIYLTHIKNSYPATNIIESEIYFPLNHTHFQKLVDNQVLSIGSDSGERHDINKNISYCIKEYCVIDNNLCNYYAVLDKNPLMVDCTMSINEITCVQNSGEYQYLNLIKNIIDNGICKQTRNGICKSIFGCQLRYDLADG